MHVAYNLATGHGNYLTHFHWSVALVVIIAGGVFGAWRHFLVKRRDGE